MALLFFVGSDKTRYGKLLEKTENKYLQMENKYPKTLQVAHCLYLNFNYDQGYYRNYRNKSETHVGLAFPSAW